MFRLSRACWAALCPALVAILLTAAPVAAQQARTPGAQPARAPIDYGTARLETACARALEVGAHSYKHVENTLKNGLEKTPLADGSVSPQPSLFHENIRGGGDYT